MKVYFINPPYKSEYGKFSREQRSPAITKSRTIYYPLWLIYAAAVTKKSGFDVKFIDAPAKQMSFDQCYEAIKKDGENTRLFVLDTSTPSIYNDVEFLKGLKKKYPDAYMTLVGTHVSALPKETLNIDKAIDAVARHEFDYIIRDLAIAIRDDKPLSGVKGITYREGDEIKSTHDDLLHSLLLL